MRKYSLLHKHYYFSFQFLFQTWHMQDSLECGYHCPFHLHHLLEHGCHNEAKSQAITAFTNLFDFSSSNKQLKVNKEWQH